MFQLDPSKPLPDAVHLAAAAAPGVEAVDPSVARYVRSRCLSTMREEVNKDIDARVTLGGKLVGYSGMYPGMLEEAYLALRDGKPLYLMGALGGCTRRMIDLLRGSDVAEFTEEYQIAHSPTVRDAAGNDVNPYRNLIDTYRNYAADTRAGHGPIDYAKLTGTLRAAGTKGLARGLNNGLTDDENDELFETNDLGRMVYLVMRGLSNVFADSAPVLDSI
jgi:hypothetical protein